MVDNLNDNVVVLEVKEFGDGQFTVTDDVT